MYSLLFRIRKFIADIDLYQARISNVGGGNFRATRRWFCTYSKA